MRIVTHKVAFLPNNQSNIDDSSITAQVTGWSKGKPNAKAQPPRKGPLLVGTDKLTKSIQDGYYLKLREC